MFIESKNSEFVFVCFSLLKRNSIASVVPIGFNILLKTKTFVSSVFSTNNSSFLVPDFNKSMAGKTLLSATFLSNTNSELPVPLNSHQLTSSILLPVSIRAVAIIVSEPPSSMFLASQKNLFGL